MLTQTSRLGRSSIPTMLVQASTPQTSLPRTAADAGTSPELARPESAPVGALEQTRTRNHTSTQLRR